MEEKILNTFHQKAYKRASWSERANDTAPRALQNSFKIFCLWYGAKLRKIDLNTFSYSKMTNIVWETILFSNLHYEAY